MGPLRPRCQGVRREEEENRHHRTRQPLPRPVLGEAAIGAARTDTLLGERYRRLARRRGKKKAVVAVGRSILVIIWHLSAGQLVLPGRLGELSGSAAVRVRRRIREAGSPV